MPLNKRLIRWGLIIGMLPIVIVFLFIIFHAVSIEWPAIIQHLLLILGSIGFIIVLPGFLIISVIEEIYFSVFHQHLLSGPSEILPAPSIVGYAFIFILYFFIGVLLGLIVEKIKDKFTKKNG